jgi:DNA recombination protein RmuC
MDISVVIGLGVLLAGLGGGLGLALGRYVWPAGAVDPAAVALAQKDAALREQECAELRARVGELGIQGGSAMDQARAASEEAARLAERVASLIRKTEEQDDRLRVTGAQRDDATAEAKTATAEVAKLAERVIGLTRQITEQGELLRAAEMQRDQLVAELTSASAQVAALSEREKALIERAAAQAQQLGEMHQQLTVEFENIANRILKARAAELSDSSETALTKLLDPLRERLQDFQQKVETTYDAEKREVISLKEQIKIMVQTSHAIGNQADGLAKALRGDSQLLGRWGELALERILEAAGLCEGREYVTQGRSLNLKSEDGRIQRPDVVVMLPEQRTLIIDSKVPLRSYERLVGALDDTERGLSRVQFVRDVKAHIDGLSGKRYQENSSLQAHDSVLMFVPIEGALAAALTSEPDLFSYAWDRGVVLVGPPTLLMTMRTVASLWRYELQGQNAQEIARLAGELCDKVSNSVGDLNMVAEKMNAAMSAHNDAVKRLSTGRGNALLLGERIRQLGVKTRRQVPAVMVDGLPVVAALEHEDDVVVEAAATASAG